MRLRACPIPRTGLQSSHIADLGTNLMTQSFSQQQIVSLAPDPQVAKAAQGLAYPDNWQNLGRGEDFAWGEYLGSGSAAYQVAVDLGGPAFRCTCPSRKRPCKHALALFMLVADASAVIAASERPTWVAQWSEERAGAKERKTHESPAAQSILTKARPSAPAQSRATKRMEQREKRIREGIAALAHWLEDLARQGLGIAQSRPPAFWDEQAARLVDAQAPGLARRVRELAAIAHSGDGWAARLLDHLGRLYLLLEAYARLERLSPQLQEEIRSQVGWTQDQDTLREQAGERDDWLVVGQRMTEQGHLRVLRTWLWGARTKQGALLLDFAPLGKPITCALMPGAHLDAELVFWPGPVRQRALVKAQHALKPMQSLPGHPNIQVAMASYSDSLAALPWLDRFLMPLVDVIPVRQGNHWVVCDGDAQALPLAVSESDGWRLTALSGGNALALAGEWDGERLSPLSAWVANQLVPLTGPSPVAGGGTSLNTWEDLVACALVGVGQAVAVPLPSGGTTALDSLLHDLAGQPAERQVLARAAVFSAWRRAGLRPLALSPARAQAPLDDRLPCPPKAADHLARILSDEALMPLLPEWLAALATGGYDLPHRWLPEMLELACQQKDLRPLVRPVIGQRGVWLAVQREPWAHLLLPTGRQDVTERWQNGLFDERLELLWHVRRADPLLGLELLSSTWPQEPPREREAFLAALSAGLSMADEPFLEAALDDRRKDVRIAAATLLAALPGSRLCQRMLDRLSHLLHCNPGGQGGLARLGIGRRLSLEVTLPTECDRAMIRDGIDLDGIAGLGVRNGWLAQMLSVVPPEIWLLRWGVRPEQALAAIAGSDWQDTLLFGWAHAAIRHHDAAWAEAIMSVLFQRTRQAREQMLFQDTASTDPAMRLIPELWPALAPARQEALLLDALQSRLPLQNGHMALSLLRQCRYPWSETLSRAVIAGLQRAIREGDASFDHTWMVRPRLKEYALYVSPALAAQATSGWDKNRPLWNAWASAVEQFMNILQFRNDMLAALPPATPA